MKTFDAWLKTHGCDTKQLWLIQNMLGDCYGDENWKQAIEAWEKSRHRDQMADNV